MATIARDPLLDHIDIGDQCWEWTAAKARNGYGRVTLKKKQHAAHRAVYELLLGPIPEGLQLDHLCRNRGCVRPAHLEPVACRENLMRGDTKAAENAAKTHCPQGHAYAGENLAQVDGRRHCRICRREACRRFQERRKAA